MIDQCSHESGLYFDIYFGSDDESDNNNQQMDVEEPATADSPSS